MITHIARFASTAIVLMCVAICGSAAYWDLLFAAPAAPASKPAK
jgi:hypothetical protein